MKKFTTSFEKSRCEADLGGDLGGSVYASLKRSRTETEANIVQPCGMHMSLPTQMQYTYKINNLSVLAFVINLIYYILVL